MKIVNQDRTVLTSGVGKKMATTPCSFQTTKEVMFICRNARRIMKVVRLLTATEVVVTVKTLEAIMESDENLGGSAEALMEAELNRITTKVTRRRRSMHDLLT